MTETFFFYDVETSGFSPRTDRIVQFAGQRTTLDLKEIGEPFNTYIKISRDVIPDPQAVLVTGITPQKTLDEGITEAEFCNRFISNIAVPGTIFVGFNSLRFDDEFIRFLLWRNYHDPYEWQWKDNRSRWDILDLARMARALRPNGVKWPFSSEGLPANKLELLASVNKLDHVNAHDAMSDVCATVALTRLIKQKQPKLYDYMFKLRSKEAVKKFLRDNDKFVYVSGRYDAAHEKASVVAKVAESKDRSGTYVYDLRYPLDQYLEMPPTSIAKAWRASYGRSEQDEKLPIKLLRYNRCPAIAPVSVLRPEDSSRLSIDVKQVDANLKKLASHKSFAANILKAEELLNNERSEQISLIAHELTAEEQLYDGFVSDNDKKLCLKVTMTEPDKLMSYIDRFQDDRLKNMLPRYKARNFASHLTAEEAAAWENYCQVRLSSGGYKSKLAAFGSKLEQLSGQKLTKQDRFVLDELLLYAQSLV